MIQVLNRVIDGGAYTYVIFVTDKSITAQHICYIYTHEARGHAVGVKRKKTNANQLRS